MLDAVYSNDKAMMGSNFPRVPLDFYPTPEWVTEAVIPTLLEMRPKETTVWECACGTGAMADVLKKHFTDVPTSDIANYGYPGTKPLDFLAYDGTADMIVTNGPYGEMAEQFIRKGLEVTEPCGGLVALLFRHEYDTAKGRVDLFNKPPFAAKLTLSTRPRWIEGSTGAPRHSYAWYIWCHRHVGSARLLYHIKSKDD